MELPASECLLVPALRDFPLGQGRPKLKNSEMLIGTYFFKGDGSTQYSVTFPRGGLAGLFVLQALQKVGTTPSLDAIVEHKNHDEAVFTGAGSFAAITATGVYSLNVTGLKEDVRISYAITATNQWEGFLLNLLAPSWRPYP